MFVDTGDDLAWVEGRSPRSTERSLLLVSNTCSVPVEMVWMTFEGTERPSGTIARGGRWTQNTFVGHLWVVRDPEGAMIRTFRAAPGLHLDACEEDDAAFDQDPPMAENQLCSTPSEHAIEIEVRNACPFALEFSWVAFDCTAQSRGWIEPGQSFFQTTYSGHVWRARDRYGQDHAHFVASENRPVTSVTCGL